jgi:hypothetical protein
MIAVVVLAVLLSWVVVSAITAVACAAVLAGGVPGRPCPRLPDVPILRAPGTRKTHASSSCRMAFRMAEFPG